MIDDYIVREMGKVASSILSLMNAFIHPFALRKLMMPCHFAHFSSTFCLETNPSTSLRTSPKIQGVPIVIRIDAADFLY